MRLWLTCIVLQKGCQLRPKTENGLGNTAFRPDLEAQPITLSSCRSKRGCRGAGNLPRFWEKGSSFRGEDFIADLSNSWLRSSHSLMCAILLPRLPSADGYLHTSAPYLVGATDPAALFHFRPWKIDRGVHLLSFSLTHIKKEILWSSINSFFSLWDTANMKKYVVLQGSPWTPSTTNPSGWAWLVLSKYMLEHILR